MYIFPSKLNTDQRRPGKDQAGIEQIVSFDEIKGKVLVHTIAWWENNILYFRQNIEKFSIYFVMVFNFELMFYPDFF